MPLRFGLIFCADGKIDFEKNNGTAHWYLQMACQQKIKYGIQKETFNPKCWQCERACDECLFLNSI